MQSSVWLKCKFDRLAQLILCRLNILVTRAAECVTRASVFPRLKGTVAVPTGSRSTAYCRNNVPTAALAAPPLPSGVR